MRCGRLHGGDSLVCVAIIGFSVVAERGTSERSESESECSESEKNERKTK